MPTPPRVTHLCRPPIQNEGGKEMERERAAAPVILCGAAALPSSRVHPSTPQLTSDRSAPSSDQSARNLSARLHPGPPSIPPPCPPVITSSQVSTQTHFLKMSSGTHSEGTHQPASKRAVNSCRKNVPGTSFVSDLRDHIHEFIHASVDEHQTCFTNTIKKMFAMSKIVTEKSAEVEEAGPESVLPLQTTVSR